MRPDVQLLAGDLADHAATTPAFLGRRWALGLGAVLLVGLGLITAARWHEGTSSPSGPEKIIQQPVPPESFPSANHSDNTAPDPGDNPP